MKVTCAIASWSSLQLATIEFLARSISSNDAVSDTPSSFSAFSTDISKGAESSAREPALATPEAADVRREREVRPLKSSDFVDFNEVGWLVGLRW